MIKAGYKDTRNCTQRKIKTIPRKERSTEFDAVGQNVTLNTAGKRMTIYKSKQHPSLWPFAK
jgi:hypothetical protein